MTSIENLKRFRHRSYNMLGNGRDALFDLMDAVITTRSVSSFVELFGLWTKSRFKRDEQHVKRDNDDFNDKTRHHPKIYYACYSD